MEKKLLGRTMLILLIMAGAGCRENSTPGTTTLPPNRGEEVFILLGCGSCHSLTGREEKKGPALKGINQRLQGREVEVQLKTPRQRQPKSKMPSFAFVRPADFQALMDYLGSDK